jgi:hypothetical protein
MKQPWSPKQKKLRRKQWDIQGSQHHPKSTKPAQNDKGDTASEKKPPSLIEYYTLAFGWLHTQLPSEFDDLDFAHEVRRTFWHLVPDRRYDRQESQDLVNSYLAVVEKRLSEEISKHSISYWIHVYRRISPEPAGKNESKSTVMIVRRTLEAAFQKFGLVDNCDGIGWSDELKQEDVLSGVPIKFRPPEIIDAYRTGPRQLLLARFGLDQLVQLYQCEKLAYEIWRCGATLRIISKGASIIVDHTADLCFYDDRSEELNALVVNYDGRSNKFIASATAAVFDSGNQKPSADRIVLLALYNIEREPAKTYKGLFESLGIKVADEFLFNFVWIPFDLKSFRDSHELFGKAFEKKNGFRFEVALIVIMTFFYMMIDVWHKEPPYLYQSFQRAFSGPSTPEDIRLSVTKQLKFCSDRLGAKEPSKEELETAISFLTLTDDKRSLISLLTGGPKFPFIPACDGRFLTDFAWLTESLNYLFLKIPLNQADLKGKMLEKLVTGGVSALPDGECKGFDGESREVDAASGRGKILVIAECKANARSIAYDRGDIAALNYRRKKFEEALDQANDKANWFASHRVGTNYDLTAFDAILPVVVTPFKEFMPSLDSRYWVRPELPRVLTPDEFAELLADPQVEEIARRCPSTVFIPLPIQL